MDDGTHHGRERDHEIIRRLFGAGGGSATIQIQAGSLAAIVVGTIGIIAVVVAVAAFLVLWAWRQADIRDMAHLRARQSTNEAYTATHERRINEIEAKLAEAQNGAGR
jgi:hypothetical protein